MMSAKDFLESANRLSSEIRALTSALDSISTEYERAEKSGIMKRSADDLRFRRNSLKADVESRLVRLFETKRDIFSLVTKIPDERERLVLILRYINNLTFAEIAKEAGYEERTVYRIHKRALESVEGILGENLFCVDFVSRQ